MQKLGNVYKYVIFHIYSLKEGFTFIPSASLITRTVAPSSCKGYTRAILRVFLITPLITSTESMPTVFEKDLTRPILRLRNLKPKMIARALLSPRSSLKIRIADFLRLACSEKSSFAIGNNNFNTIGRFFNDSSFDNVDGTLFA